MTAESPTKRAEPDSSPASVGETDEGRESGSKSPSLSGYLDRKGAGDPTGKGDTDLASWGHSDPPMFGLNPNSNYLNTNIDVKRGNDTSTTDFIFLGLFPDMGHISYLTYVILLSYIIAIFGNTILILLIWLDSLHTPMYLLLSQLSVMDLILISTTVPKMVTDFWMDRKNISQVSCGIQMLFYIAITGSESILLTLMSYDRYVAVCNPLRYSVIMNSRICLHMATFPCVMGFLNSLVHTVFTMHLPVCDPRDIYHFFCEILAILNLSCDDTSVYEMILFVTGIAFILIPFGLILASYSLIFLSVFHMKSQKGKNKSLATCSSHLTVVSLYLGSGFFVLMVLPTMYSAEESQAVSLFYNILTPMLNPIIYSLRNKEVVGALRKVLAVGIGSQIKEYISFVTIHFIPVFCKQG
ncbi:LOW QUALITY PROTEIN: olfactory receptor 2M5-like [Trichechus inunguis]